MWDFGQKVFHITANGTTNVIDGDSYFSWAKAAVIDGGTNWVIKLQDKETPPNVLLCASYASNEKDTGAVFFQAPDPVFMKGGASIVASGGTPGNVFVWLFGWNEKTEP